MHGAVKGAKCEPSPNYWFCLSPNARHRFERRVKPSVSHRLALIERQADIVDRCVIEVRAEQRTISCLPFPVVSTQCAIQRMRLQPRIRLPQPIRT